MCFSLCSGFVIFYHEADTLKSIFYKRNFLLDLIDNLLKRFRHNIGTKTYSNCSTCHIWFVYQCRGNCPVYLIKLSLWMHTRMHHKIKKTNFLTVITGVFSQAERKTSNLLTIRYTVPSLLRFGIVYKF